MLYSSTGIWTHIYRLSRAVSDKILPVLPVQTENEHNTGWFKLILKKKKKILFSFNNKIMSYYQHFIWFPLH